MNLMDIEEINAIKLKLPFYKNDINKFYLNYKILENKAEKLPELVNIDLFYTLLSLGYASLSLKFFKACYNTLSLNYKMELIKILSFYESINFKDIKQIYEQINEDILKQKNYEELFYELAFYKNSFFKPLLTNHVKLFTSLTNKIQLYLIDLCKNNIKNVEYLLNIYERILSFREFSEEEKSFINGINIKSLKNDGKLIDIMLRSGDIFMMNNAIKLMKTGDNIYTSEHGVHYIKINEKFVELINSHKISEEVENITIMDFVNNVKKLSNKSEIFHNIINMILVSNYSDSLTKLKLSNVFVFIWSTINEEFKQELIKELSKLTDICCSGFLINLIGFYSGFKQDVYLEENQEFIDKDKKIKELREKYPENDPFWLDTDRIEKELN